MSNDPTVVALGDNMHLLAGRPYLVRVTGAESVQTSRFADAMLAAGFRRAGGFLRGAALDPADFRVTQLRNGAIATELDCEPSQEWQVREARAAIAVAVWQAGSGRPTAVELGESRQVPGNGPAEEPDDGPGILDTVREVARLPLYLTVAGIAGFAIYLYFQVRKG